MRRVILTSVLLVVPALVLAQGSTGDEYFDMSRFDDQYASLFETFAVEETRSLAQALDAGLVAEETAVLVTETATGKLALLTDQMWWHHLAQGVAAGEPWLVSF